MNYDPYGTPDTICYVIAVASLLGVIYYNWYKAEKTRKQQYKQRKAARG